MAVLRAETEIPSIPEVPWIGTYDEHFDTQVQADMAADFCASNARYHYCYDQNCADKMFEFDAYVCERLPFFEAFQKTQSSEGYLFYVPTFFKELNVETRRYHGGDDCAVGCPTLGPFTPPATRQNPDE